MKKSKMVEVEGLKGKKFLVRVKDVKEVHSYTGLANPGVKTVVLFYDNRIIESSQSFEVVKNLIVNNGPN